MNERVIGEKKAGRSHSPSTNFKQLVAQFTNTGTDPKMRNAELYFQDKFWGKLGFGDATLGANTYAGHQWNVKVDGKTVKSWTITEKDGTNQNFSI